MKTLAQKPMAIFLYSGILMLASEAWKQWCLTYMLGGGHYNWWYFPFQLCSIPMYICLILPWIKHEKIQGALLTFLMDFGLLAGIFVFFDTSGMHYPYMPLTVHSYLWHFGLIFLGICAGCTKKADYSRAGFLKSAGIYLACSFLATLCNLAFYPYGMINMFYISPHYNMTQKVFCHIAAYFGNGAGITAYIAATILGAYLFHLFWRYRNASTAFQ